MVYILYFVMIMHCLYDCVPCKKIKTVPVKVSLSITVLSHLLFNDAALQQERCSLSLQNINCCFNFPPTTMLWTINGKEQNRWESKLCVILISKTYLGLP